jgi:hypothetical protein
MGKNLYHCKKKVAVCAGVDCDTVSYRGDCEDQRIGLLQMPLLSSSPLVLCLLWVGCCQASLKLFHWNMHWQCSALSDCRVKAETLVKSKLDDGFDLVSLVELEDFSALPPTPHHDLLMNVIAQDPSSRLDDAALLWFSTNTFKKLDSGPIFFGGISSNGTAPVTGQGFYVGNWAELQRKADGSKCLVVQGHFSHDLLQSGAALNEAVPNLRAIVNGSANTNLVMLADTNDNQKTNLQVQETVFGWKASDPPAKPVTNPAGSTCCFEHQYCDAGVACCWSGYQPYDKFLVRIENAVEITETIEIVDLTVAGLGDNVLSGWDCQYKPGAGEMHRPVQLEIELQNATRSSLSVSA